METYELELTGAEAAALIENLPQTTVKYCGVIGIIPDDKTQTILIIPAEENATIQLTRKTAAWLAATLNQQVQDWKSTSRFPFSEISCGEIVPAIVPRTSATLPSPASDRRKHTI